MDGRTDGQMDGWIDKQTDKVCQVWWHTCHLCVQEVRQYDIEFEANLSYQQGSFSLPPYSPPSQKKKMRQRPGARI